jgi:hypothetical protein
MPRPAWIAAVSFVPFGVMALWPLVYLAFTANVVDFAPEFVYYRVGDALSLLNGEGSYVHPVQGLPTALLSKALTWLIGDGVVQRQGLKLYGQLWVAAIAVPVIFAASRSAAARMALVLPMWCGTAAIGLMVAPEYWQGEWIYLALTLALLPKLRELPRAHLIAGAWAALGVSVKITLFPVAALLLLEIGQWRKAWQFAAAFVLAYFIIAAVYMGDVRLTVVLLDFQRRFFLHPNDSAGYAGFVDALMAHPAIPVALGFVIAAMRLHWRHAAVAAWCLLYCWLVKMRAHDSSLTSFGISLGFMLALLYRWQAVACIAVLLFAVDRGTTVSTWMRMPSYYVTQDARLAEFERFFPPADKVTWFMSPLSSPNAWNAAFPVQGFGYNGGLALRAQPRLFHKLWPNTFIDWALPSSGVVYWTRPAGSKPPLPNAEEMVSLDGRWIFGKARRQKNSSTMQSPGAPRPPFLAEVLLSEAPPPPAP